MMGAGAPRQKTEGAIPERRAGGAGGLASNQQRRRVRVAVLAPGLGGGGRGLGKRTGGGRGDEERGRVCGAPVCVC